MPEETPRSTRFLRILAAAAQAVSACILTLVAGTVLSDRMDVLTGHLAKAGFLSGSALTWFLLAAPMVLQFAYVVPLFRLVWRRGRTALAMGLAAGAALIVSLKLLGLLLAYLIPESNRLP